MLPINRPVIRHYHPMKNFMSQICSWENPHFVACSVAAYLELYDVVDGIREHGTFLLNSIWDAEETVKRIPNRVKKILATHKANFYIINATNIAEEIGLGNRTNTILQSAFFKITNVIPYELAVEKMKYAIVKSYGKKGQAIIDNAADQPLPAGMHAADEATVARGDQHRQTVGGHHAHLLPADGGKHRIGVGSLRLRRAILMHDIAVNQFNRRHFAIGKGGGFMNVEKGVADTGDIAQ